MSFKVIFDHVDIASPVEMVFLTKDAAMIVAHALKLSPSVTCICVWQDGEVILNTFRGE